MTNTTYQPETGSHTPSSVATPPPHTSGRGADSTPKGIMAYQQIRSATAIVNCNGVRFLIDPWLGAKDSCPGLPVAYDPTLRSPIHELPLPISEIIKVDAVIATHLHFDHFDEEAVRVIPKEKPIFAQDQEDASTLQGYGFKDVRILRYGGTNFQGVILHKTDCMHGAPGERGRMYEEFQMRGEACGVVISHPNAEKKLYLAGDTIWCDYVADTIHRFNPDVIIVNAAEATVRGYSPIIMGISDIRKVLAYAPNATIIASHMDNIPHARLTRKDLRLFIEKNGLENRLLLPQDGETVCF